MNPTTIVNKSVHLKPGREKSLIRRHPWVFSGAIQSVGGDPLPGETVEIYDNQGNFLARGAYSPDSQIRVRVWTWIPMPSAWSMANRMACRAWLSIVTAIF
jgi:23S rRNA G2069 N7-methylase RlmK/C1962 C5-methylase RlmI